MKTKSRTKETTSLTRENDENLKGRLRIGRMEHVEKTGLKKIRSKSVIRIVPRSESNIMTNVGRSVSRGEKKFRKSRARDMVRIQSELIEVILNGAKGNLDKNLFVGSKVEKGGIILATET
jgi:hypothetical protein